jgi:GntR family transcriptional regulator
MDQRNGSGGLRIGGLDRKSHVPLYIQLKEVLNENIQRGQWKPLERIPGEPELCRSFGVSRTVVRQALKEMEYEGLIVREKGRGTFVAAPRISSRSLVHSLAGFYEDMAERGLEPINKILEQTIMPADPKLAEHLSLEEMEPVIKLTRLRFVGDEPIVWVTSYIPYEACRGLIQAELSNQSLYAFLERECSLRIHKGWRRIDAVAADEHQAVLFEIDEGSPLLRLESVSFLENGRPLEYFVALFRSDRTCFEVELDRIPKAQSLRVEGEV